MRGNLPLYVSYIFDLVHFQPQLESLLFILLACGNCQFNAIVKFFKNDWSLMMLVLLFSLKCGRSIVVLFEGIISIIGLKWDLVRIMLETGFVCHIFNSYISWFLNWTQVWEVENFRENAFKSIVDHWWFLCILI